VRDSFPEKLGTAAFIFIISVAAALRLWRLDHFSYGLDEILQTYFVHGSWKFFWKSLKFDAVHPPLDYLITRAIEAFGPADWVRKIPAVLWGLGTIAALSVLIRRRAGITARFFTALLLTFAPFHVRYSQELRPYSLGLFLLCLSMLLLDLLLARPSWPRLLGFFLACLATMYALYMAALVLGIASFALLIDEAFSRQEEQRVRARRFLRWSLLFGLALFVAYLPWLPVVLDAAKRSPPVPAPPFTWERFTRFLSFFAFAPDDGQPLGRKGPLYLALVGVGLVIALRRRALRFIAIWLIGGCVAIEALEHLHPHWYVTRHFLTAGVVMPALASLPLAWLWRKRTTDVLASVLATFPRALLAKRQAARALAIFLAALPLGALTSRRATRLFAVSLITTLVLFDVRSLQVYFREGRPDWRPLGNYLKRRPPAERIFTENQYSQLSVAFYTAGPGFLAREGRTTPEIYTLEREPIILAWSWKPNTTAWLVLAGPPPDERLRQWSKPFPSIAFPKAEGAILKRLDPALWGATVPLLPTGKTPVPP